MKRKEQIEKAALEYINSDAVNPMNMQMAFGDFINGAKWADKTMIEKACKWLLNIDFDGQEFRDCDESFNNDLFVDAFRKAMEK